MKIKNNTKRFFEKVYTKVYCIFLPHKISTSLSDNQAYPQVCIDAANNFKHFNRFRRNPIYAGIVETVSEDFGKKYLDIFSKDKQIINNIEEFKKNDDWGGAIIFNYQDVGSISPTTLRYIKVLSDLRKYFIKLDGLNICEIGVGYGGQCRIVNAMSSPGSYCMVDIHPALQLAQRYLNNYIVNAVLSFKTMNELDYNKDYDLCVSNYAFSELPRSLQDVYLKKIILRSKMGYVTYSDNFTPPEFNSYRVDELLKIIPGAIKINENPVTGPNLIILWGIKNAA